MGFWKNGHIPAPPYYAVIFVSEKSDDLEGYAQADKETLDLAMQQEGFLGYESLSQGHEGIFISYWQTEEAISKWREHEVHRAAKTQGKKRWYTRYLSQICKVEHSHEMKK